MPMDILERFLRPLRTRPLTRRYPDEPAVLAPALRGLPELDPSRCDSSGACIAVCPTAAITLEPTSWAVDAGRCVLCGACEAACPRDAIRLGQRFELASRRRESLHIVTRLGGST
jgi:Formate hydrogenlyase subunit 6/NADH:ubiquinone oxidoreductase 23 kD subunit (chain I)